AGCGAINRAETMAKTTMRIRFGIACLLPGLNDPPIANTLAGGYLQLCDLLHTEEQRLAMRPSGDRRWHDSRKIFPSEGQHDAYAETHQRDQNAQVQANLTELLIGHCPTSILPDRSALKAACHLS